MFITCIYVLKLLNLKPRDSKFTIAKLCKNSHNEFRQLNYIQDLILIRSSHEPGFLYSLLSWTFQITFSKRFQKITCKAKVVSTTTLNTRAQAAICWCHFVSLITNLKMSDQFSRFLAGQLCICSLWYCLWYCN